MSTETTETTREVIVQTTGGYRAVAVNNGLHQFDHDTQVFLERCTQDALGEPTWLHIDDPHEFIRAGSMCIAQRAGLDQGSRFSKGPHVIATKIGRVVIRGHDVFYEQRLTDAMCEAAWRQMPENMIPGTIEAALREFEARMVEDG